MRKIKEELARQAEEKRLKELEKERRAKDAYEKWARLRVPNQRLVNLHDRAKIETV